ncbi:hypothetical protein [Bradyrhizobium pachyrhizi]|uniref:hypothetical protein n=1 Tax=Bradyrhizobium pachyrhizi TaxID=280333 RepID=UPI000B1BB30E|nr:hypothetical protein [Bradyrhizobium pachyrhizi]
MNAFEVFAIYLAPFVIIAIAIRLLMQRHAVDLPDVQKQAGLRAEATISARRLAVGLGQVADKLGCAAAQRQFSITDLADGASDDQASVWFVCLTRSRDESRSPRTVEMRTPIRCRPCLVRNCAREQGPITTGRHC